MLEANATWKKPEPPNPVHLLFLGPREYERCSLSKSAWAVTKFVEFRLDAPQHYIQQAVSDFHSHVVICFCPELLPKGVLQGIPSLTVGITTGSVPRTAGKSQEETARRLSPFHRIDIDNFDRLVHFDVRSLDFLRSQKFSVWRGLPLPVDWHRFENDIPLSQRRGLVFLGRATAGRERFLRPLKQNFELLQLENSVDSDELRQALARCAIGIDLSGEDGSAHEHCIPVYFAGGALVLTNDPNPMAGLENEEDHIKFRTPEELCTQARNILREPSLYEGIRQLALAKRPLFDSEQVYRGLVEDLYVDVAVYGRGVRNSPVCSKSS